MIVNYKTPKPECDERFGLPGLGRTKQNAQPGWGWASNSGGQGRNRTTDTGDLAEATWTQES